MPPVAERLATRPGTVSKWRGRFAQHGLAGVADAPRSGKPWHYDADHERRIIAALDAPPPKGYARWDGSLLAKHRVGADTPAPPPRQRNLVRPQHPPDLVLGDVVQMPPSGWDVQKRYPAGTSTSTNVRLTEAEIHAVSTACRTAVGSHR
jgi:hypothetical protein